jgi:Replication initiator protein, pSAM2
VGYLAKYVTKAIGDPLGDNSESDPAREAHIDRLHAELRWPPCSPRCANWLRYGIQPDRPSPGLSPGRCPSFMIENTSASACLPLSGLRTF